MGTLSGERNPPPCAFSLQSHSRFMRVGINLPAALHTVCPAFGESPSAVTVLGLNFLLRMQCLMLGFLACSRSATASEFCDDTRYSPPSLRLKGPPCKVLQDVEFGIQAPVRTATLDTWHNARWQLTNWEQESHCSVYILIY